MLQYCIITAAAKSQVSKVRTIAGNKKDRKKAKRKSKNHLEKKHVFQTFLPILSPVKKLLIFSAPHSFLVFNSAHHLISI